jgi:single-strand DNA-binding protein
VEGVNKVTLVGHIGRDAQRAPVEFPLLKFTLAVNERRWTPNGYKTATSWHNCVLRGKRVPYLEKKLKSGVPVYIEGRLNNRSYVGKDGVKRYVTEVEVGATIILFPKGLKAAQGVAEQEEENNKSTSDGVQADVAAPEPQQHDDEAASDGGMETYDDDVPF